MALCAVAAACAGVFVASGNAIRRQQRDAQNDAAARVTAALASGISDAEASLEDTAAFFGASRHVSHGEFIRFTAQQLKRPGIRAIGFISRVPGRRRSAFESEIGAPITVVRRDGTLGPAPRRREYFPVAMVAADPGVGKSHVGFDGHTDPTRRAGMQAAAHTGRPAATRPFRTLDGSWLPALYVAAYRPSGRLSGFVVAGVDSHALVQAAAAAFPGGASVRVLDGRRLVYSLPGDYSRARRTRIPIGGRWWVVEVSAPAPIGAAQRLRWIVAICGIALLFTLFALFRRAARQTQHAERLVARRTQQLQERTRQLDAALSDAETARAALSERNEALLELDRFKDRMLALISHDLRSPLTSVRGYVELLLDEETGPLAPNQLRFLGVVKRNAERLDSQIGDLLLAASAAEGRLQLQRSAVDVSRLVTEAADSARPQALEKSIELEVTCRPLQPIEADGPRLAQVLDNLLSNAVKYTPEGGRVSVRAWVEDGSVTIRVSDTGPGLSPEEQVSIFEPFFRTDDAKERGIRGTGLGLVAVKAIVEAHGGRVTVQSTPGHGSRFLIRVPAAMPTPWMPSERLTTLSV